MKSSPTAPATTRKPSRRRNPLAPTADDIRTGFRLDHQFSNARIEELEVAAQAADLDHDVAQAAGDSDVIVALTPRYKLLQVTTEESGRAGIDLWVEIQDDTFKAFYMTQDCGFFPTEADAIDYLHNRAIAQVTAWQTMKADAETHRLNQSMPHLPPFIYPTASGFTWQGADESYPHYIAADEARTKWLAQR